MPLKLPRIALVICGIPFLASTLAAEQIARQTSPVDHGNTPRIRAGTVSSAVSIDGLFNDAAWAGVTPSGLTAQRDPDEGQLPTERTEFRVLVGEDALYIGARMFDSEPQNIVSRLGRRDDPLAGDRITIRLDPRHDHLTSFVFDVYPAGNKGDASVGADGVGDRSWDPVWDVATRIDSLGWSAEIRIPFAQLRYDRSSDDWGIQFERYIQRKREEDVLSYVPRNESDGANRYGHLSGMQNLPSTRHIAMVPYTAARAEFQTVAPADPFRSGKDVFASAGADVKMGVTSDLTLDLTLNPDFGQVEVDPAVVNLSAFEVILGERRPFFVAGGDLFRFGQLRTFNAFSSPATFFSRRIGRTPQGFISDPDATFQNVPQQTTIAGAAKLTGKTRNGWSIALLDAVTAEEKGSYVVDGSTSVLRESVEPLTNYFVGRVRREMRDGNTSIGSILTGVNRSLDVATLERSLRSSAYVAGVDLNHYWNNRMWSVGASISGSLLNGSEESIAAAQRSNARYFQRPDANHVEYDPTRTRLSGHAAQFALTKAYGGHWGGNVAYQEASPGYETNDIGVTQTVGRRSIASDIHYIETQPGPIFRDYTIGLMSGNEWNYDGDHITSYVGGIVNFRMRNFWTINSNGFFYLPAYSDQLTRGGPLARIPLRSNVNIALQSDSRRAWSLSANGDVNWNAAGGYSRSMTLGANYQPASNLSLGLGPSFTMSRNVSQFVRAVSDPLALDTYGRRSVFATVEQRQLALDTRVDWTWSPKTSLQLFVQPLISAADFGDYKEFATPGRFDFTRYGTDAGTISRDEVRRLYSVDPDADGPAAAFAIPDQDFNLRSLVANMVFRWEYRPGSTLFFVWQQSRAGAAPIGDFSLRRDLGEIFGNPATNVVAVKMTYLING